MTYAMQRLALLFTLLCFALPVQAQSWDTAVLGGTGKDTTAADGRVGIIARGAAGLSGTSSEAVLVYDTLSVGDTLTIAIDEMPEEVGHPWTTDQGIYVAPSTDANSRFYALTYSVTGLVWPIHRPADGAETVYGQGAGMALPVYLRAIYDADEVTLQYSADSLTWADGEIASVTGWDDVLAGRVASSYDADSRTVAWQRAVGVQQGGLQYAASVGDKQGLLSYQPLDGDDGNEHLDAPQEDLVFMSSLPGYATGIRGQGAQFESGDEPGNVRGGLSFQSAAHHLAGYVRFDDLTSSRGLFGRWDAISESKRRYRLYYDNSTGHLTLQLQTESGTPTLAASSFGALEEDTWYAFEVAHDGTTTEICVRESGSARVCDSADIGPAHSPTTWTQPHVGTDEVSGALIGMMDEVSIWKTVPSDEARDKLTAFPPAGYAALTGPPVLPVLDDYSVALYNYLKSNTVENTTIPDTVTVSVKGSPSGQDLATLELMLSSRPPEAFPAPTPSPYDLLDDGAGKGIEGHADTIRVRDFTVGDGIHNLGPNRVHAWQHPGLWNGYRQPGVVEPLCRRVAAKAFPWAITYKPYTQLGEYWWNWVKDTGGMLIAAAQTFNACGEVWPDEVRDAYVSYISHLTERLGTITKNNFGNMAMKGAEGAGRVIEAMRRQGAPELDDYAALADESLRRVILGSKDAHVADMEISAEAFFHPAGCITENKGCSGRYEGYSVTHLLNVIDGVRGLERFAWADTVGYRLLNKAAMWVPVGPEGVAAPDRVTGNRTEGAPLTEWLEWSEHAGAQAAALYCTPEWNYVGCRVGMRDYRRSSDLYATFSRSESELLSDAQSHVASISEGSPAQTAPYLRPQEVWNPKVRYPRTTEAWYDNVRAFADAEDGRTWPINAPASSVGDTVMVTGPDTDAHPRQSYRLRRATDPSGRRFGYLIEHTDIDIRQRWVGKPHGKVSYFWTEAGGTWVSHEEDAFERTLLTNGGTSYWFDHSPEVTEHTNAVTVYPDSVERSYRYGHNFDGDSIQVDLTWRDLDTGVETERSFDWDADGDGQVTEVDTYRHILALHVQNLSESDTPAEVGVYDGQAWKDLPSEYERIKWIRLLRSGVDTTWVEFPDSADVRLASVHEDDYETVRVAVNLHPDPGTVMEAPDTSLVYRFHTAEVDPGHETEAIVSSVTVPRENTVMPVGAPFGMRVEADTAGLTVQDIYFEYSTDFAGDEGAATWNQLASTAEITYEGDGVYEWVDVDTPVPSGVTALRSRIVAAETGIERTSVSEVTSADYGVAVADSFSVADGTVLDENYAPDSTIFDGGYNQRSGVVEVQNGAAASGESDTAVFATIDAEGGNEAHVSFEAIGTGGVVMHGRDRTNYGALVRLTSSGLDIKSDGLGDPAVDFTVESGEAYEFDVWSYGRVFVVRVRDSEGVTQATYTTLTYSSYGLDNWPNFGPGFRWTSPGSGHVDDFVLRQP